VELRKLVEEFLLLNERQKAGTASPRELARRQELHARLTAWREPGRDEAHAVARAQKR
jgi:hypothetical protein